MHPDDVARPAVLRPPVLRPGVGGVRRGRAGGAHPLGRGRHARLQREHGAVHARGGVLDPPPAVAAAARRASSTSFPNLKYAPVECGSWWVGDLLFKTDVMFGGTNWKVKKMSSQTKGLIERLPSEYFGTNVFIGASAMSKPELRRRYVNGLDAPHVGHRLPAPRGHVAQHGRPASPPTSGRSRSRRPACCSGSTRCGATTSTSTPSAGIAADIGPTPERAQPGPRPAARPPTRSARPASGSTTTASSGRTDDDGRGRRRRRCSSTARSPSSPAGPAASGAGIVGALLRRGATVVIADVEAGARRRRRRRPRAARPGLGAPGRHHRRGRRRRPGRRRLRRATARSTSSSTTPGVTSGGGGKPWQQEPNDWRWCFGVNVFGTAICTSAFVPRMIDGGEPGQVVNTSSGDGGFAPVPIASVYAASKAAVSCFTESLHHNLVSEGTALRASVFYPSGGLLRTGLFTAARNRPERLARVGQATGRRSMTLRRDEGDAGQGRAATSPRPTSTSSATSPSPRPPPGGTSSPATSTTPSSCSTAGPTPSAAARSRPTTACRCSAGAMCRRIIRSG